MVDQFFSMAGNFALAVAAALAARAYWPRRGMPENAASRLFHTGFILGAVAVAINAAAWGTLRAATLLGFDPFAQMIAAGAIWGDGAWKLAAATAYVAHLAAKLAAIGDAGYDIDDPAHRRHWNIATVAWHPDSSAAVVRALGAVGRAWSRGRA